MPKTDHALHQPGAREHEPRWFALWTKQRAEKAVARRLAGEAVEHWLPLVTLERRWSDRMRRVAFPLLPNYLFVRVRAPDLAPITRLPGVLTVIRAAGEPIEVRNSELAALRALVAMLPVAETPPEIIHDFEPGDQVQVISGPFAGLTGLVQARRGGRRLLVALERMSVAVSIEIGEASVAPAAPHA